MNYRKAFSRITLITWSMIALYFLTYPIVPHMAEAKVLFKPKIDYVAGDRPLFVAIGDLNGDSNPDLAVANYFGYVSVLLGNGDGTFQDAMSYPAGDLPTSIAIGDLNGDGNLDMSVANYFGYVSVLLGNGEGSFQSAVNYPAGDQSTSVAIGDLNGDDNLDLAVTNFRTDRVLVLLGNGNGTFQDAVNYAAGLETLSVAIGDLNGDDNLDLAVANNFDGPIVSVLLGNGDGTFKRDVGPGCCGGSDSVAIGDLNGDENLDLAVVNIGAGDVILFLGNGDGTFQNPGYYQFGGSTGSVTPFQFDSLIAIGDLDGDAKADLAVGNKYNDSVSILFGNGDGSFQDAVNYRAGSEPSSVAIGDLNGDGNLDLAISNDVSGNVSILINIGGVNNLLYTPVTPCRIADTRKSGGIIGANTKRDFHVYGSGSTILPQGGNPAGCSSPLGQPLAAHINMIAVNPTGKGNLQAFPVGAGTGAGLSVNYNTIDTNLANAGTVKTVTGAGPDITVASNFSSAHTVIDVLGYYYPDEGFLYAPVMPCRIVDTRYTSAGIIDANTERNFRVFGSGGTIFSQGGNPDGCFSPLGEPSAAHINMVAVNPYGKGNLQAFPVGAEAGAGLSVNYNIFDTNLANAGTVKTNEGAGADITVASNFSSTNTVIDVLGYYYPDGDLLYTPVKPCRIVDTRYTSAGIIDANTERNFRVFGSGGIISAQGGNLVGCTSPQGEPLAVHINMVAVNPTGKGNLQAFPVGAGTGAGISVNYNTIDTNLANAGTVKTVTGTGADITVTSNFSSAHTVIDVLGHYYSAP